MSATTKIEWTEKSWNAIFGCDKISPGCTHCYAHTIAYRRLWKRKLGYQENPFEFRLVPEAMNFPFSSQSLTAGHGSKIFVNSMSDFFHDECPTEYIATTCEVMAKANWHIFQILTKRHQRMRELLSGDLRWAAELPNVLWGVSVENERYGLPRIQALQQTPVKHKWLSLEPLLDAIPSLPLDQIAWVVAGGESGPKYRPCNPDWVRSIRDQCQAKGVPFFFKQWGTNRKADAGRTLDGRTWDEYPVIELSPLASSETRKRLFLDYQLVKPERIKGRTPLEITDSCP